MDVVGKPIMTQNSESIQWHCLELAMRAWLCPPLAVASWASVELEGGAVVSGVCHLLGHTGSGQRPKRKQHSHRSPTTDTSPSEVSLSSPETPLIDLGKWPGLETLCSQENKVACIYSSHKRSHSGDIPREESHEVVSLE